MTNADRILLAKEKIFKDMAKNILPFELESFSQLHDFVDANMYGLNEDESLPDDFIKIFNYVHSYLDKWIKSGDYIDEYFKFMFGEEFMNSNDKGTLKEY